MNEAVIVIKQPHGILTASVEYQVCVLRIKAQVPNDANLAPFGHHKRLVLAGRVFAVAAIQTQTLTHVLVAQRINAL